LIPAWWPSVWHDQLDGLDQRPRFWPTAKTLGHTSPWVASIWLRDGSMIHWPSSSRPCGSFRISRWPKVTRPGAGLLRVLEGGTAPAQRALRLSPHDPLAAVYCGTASYAEFVGHNYDEAMRLAREGVRQRADFVGAHRVLTAAAGMAGRSHRRCQGRVAGAAARTAQYFARLDRQANANPTRGRAGALSGRIPPRRFGLMPRSLDYRSGRFS
jgi:hypothetical protein